MRVVLWIRGDEHESRTSDLNRVIYERASDGRRLGRFWHPQVEVGEHTYGLRRDCFFAYHPDDRVRMGKFCSIADGVRFVFGGHRVDSVSSFPFQAVCFGGLPHADAPSNGQISIGNDVWIGTDVIILSGVEIGHGAVVGAGAIVTKSVPPYAVVGGVPARIIRYRLSEAQIAALLKIRWWDWPLGKIKENLDLFYGDPASFIKKYRPEN